MKNKKVLIIIIVVIVLLAVILGVYKARTSFLFNEEGKIEDGHSQLIEHLKSIEDEEERRKQIDFSLQSNIITQKEANLLY